MKTRIITGSLIGLAVAGCFALRFISPYFFDVLIGIIMVCGAGEVSKVFNRSGKFNNMTTAVMFPAVLIISLFVCTYYQLHFLYVLLIELGVFALFALITLLWTFCDKKSLLEEKKEGQSEKKYVWTKFAYTLVIMAYPTLILSALFYINHMSQIGLTSQDSVLIGFVALVFLFVTTMFTDVCAYFVGSLLKGKKLCPFISPKKTISGAIGGLFGAILGAVGTYYILLAIPEIASIIQLSSLKIWWILIYSLVASVVSQAGDIFASWLKRRARTKDFSTIFPGHGGFMDRCDGLSFNAIITLIFFAIMF